MDASAKKAALRKATRATLRALSAEFVTAASERACARAAKLTVSASAVSCYLAMPKAECVTTPLLEHLFAAGTRVYVPRVEGMGREDMRMLHVSDAVALEAYPRSKWGIPEPTDEQAALMDDGLLSAAIDTVIVPAVAFDASCQRLGQGKGYYDTWLEKLQQTRALRGLRPATTIGLGLQEQLVDEVPTDVHDVPLDYVCLPDALLRRSAPPAAAGVAGVAGAAEAAEAPAALDGRALRPRKAKEAETLAPPAHPVHGHDTGLLPED